MWLHIFLSTLYTSLLANHHVPLSGAGGKAKKLHEQPIYFPISPCGGKTLPQISPGCFSDLPVNLSPCIPQIQKRHSSSSIDERPSPSLSAREYVESLHQNSRVTLLFGKNNVLVQPVTLTLPPLHFARESR